MTRAAERRADNSQVRSGPSVEAIGANEGLGIDEPFPTACWMRKDVRQRFARTADFVTTNQGGAHGASTR